MDKLLVHSQSIIKRGISAAIQDDKTVAKERWRVSKDQNLFRNSICEIISFDDWTVVFVLPLLRPSHHLVSWSSSRPVVVRRCLLYHVESICTLLPSPFVAVDKETTCLQLKALRRRALHPSSLKNVIVACEPAVAPLHPICRKSSLNAEDGDDDDDDEAGVAKDNRPRDKSTMKRMMAVDGALFIVGWWSCRRRRQD